MELTYKRSGEYLIPNLTVSTEPYRIGKYGMMRRTFLLNNRRSKYNEMLMSGALLGHLEEIDRTAKEQIDAAVKKMAESEQADEQMKAKDPLGWAGMMNNFRSSAEEQIMRELIFS